MNMLSTIYIKAIKYLSNMYYINVKILEKYKFTSLVSLDLQHTHVIDTTISHLSLSSLIYPLILINSHKSIISYLPTLKNLSLLDLRNTQITDALGLED